MPHASVEHEFKALVTLAGCPEHRFHDLRHTYCTNALRAHVDIKLLSRYMGHKSVAFTLDVYGHICDEMTDDYVELIDSIIAARTSLICP